MIFVALWFLRQCVFLLLCVFCCCVVCSAVAFVAVWFLFLCGLCCCMVSVAVHSVLHANRCGFFNWDICQHVPLAVDLA